LGYLEFLQKYWPAFVGGTVTTLKVYSLAMVLGVAVALMAALMRMSPFFLVRAIATVYVECFRGTSLLVQLFWLYYVLPLFGLQLDKYLTGVLVLGFNMASYGSEVVRGAIQSVPRGQYEAAVALNLSPTRRMKRIILPQAFLLMLPPWGNLFVEYLKYSSVVSLITITDLMFRAKQINDLTFKGTQAFGTAALIYYVLSRLIIIPGMRMFERFWARHIGMVADHV
jgi:polar amino acid transport system permease protein